MSSHPQFALTLNKIPLHKCLFAVVLGVHVEMINGLLEIELFIRRVNTSRTHSAEVRECST